MNLDAIIKLFTPIKVKPIINVTHTTDGLPVYTPISGATSYLPAIVSLIVNTILYLGGALVVIAIIWGGIMYITAAGDAAKAERARNTITYAIIGAIVIMMSFVIIKVVVSAIS